MVGGPVGATIGANAGGSMLGGGRYQQMPVNLNMGFYGPRGSNGGKYAQPGYYPTVEQRGNETITF